MSRTNEFAWFLSGISVASIAYYYINRIKSKETRNLDRNTIKSSSIENATTFQPDSFPVELKEELLSRSKSYFGDDKFHKIESSFVIVVGLGGVGSHAANMLVRSGVGRIRLIDFDQVSLSSLNRHAIASLEDVGTSKAMTMKKKLSKICPWCQIDSITEIFKMESAERLLDGKPDYVLDCIDDIHTKGALIAYCVQNGIQVLTSMGAGAKADPTKLRIAPLSDCVNDPLAAKIKWKMRKLGVSSENVMSVFSIEKPTVDLLPLQEEQAAAPQDYGNVDYFRIRVMPVLGTSPSIFGQTMASYVLCQLAGMPYEPSGFDNLSKKVKEKMRVAFKREEADVFNNYDADELHDEDLDFLINTVWKARCAVTGKRFFGPTTMTITRWYASEPPSLDNLVVISRNESKILHDQGSSAFDADIVAKIEARLAWTKLVCERYWQDAGGENEIVYYQPHIGSIAASSTHHQDVVISQPQYTSMVIGCSSLFMISMLNRRYM